MFSVRTVAFHGNFSIFQAQNVLMPHYKISTVKFGIFEKNMPFNYRKWNILAFRGRLMSLLVLTHSGVSPRPHLPQESRIFHLLDRLSLSFTASFFTPSQFHKRFNLFIIRSTASLIGTEGGDSYGNSMSLETPQ